MFRLNILCRGWLGGKESSDSLKKFVSNVGDDIGVVWGVEPYYISASRSFRKRSLFMVGGGTEEKRVG